MGKHGINVVVGIPTFGTMSVYFTQARAQQQFPLVSSSTDKYVIGKEIAEARNEIVQFALDQDANYIYWLDDDVIPPPDAFLKMFRHQKDIINGVYWSKSNPPMPLMFRGHLDGPYWDWHYGDLIEVDAAGSGLTLVKTEVYRKIEKEIGGPWYSTSYASFPGVKASPVNNTEDLYFYWKARTAGYKIWVDTSVQAFHYEKNTNVMYSMPPNAPQALPAWEHKAALLRGDTAGEIKPQGSKLIADLGSGPTSPYMRDEGEVVSFDIREDVAPDVICDVRRLPVPDETFDIVFSSHTLEHFSWRTVDAVLKEWARVLKVGGEIRLVVPNARYLWTRLRDDTLLPTDFWVLLGEQEYPKNYHAMMFTPKVLYDVINSLGIFENIQIREGDVEGPPAAESWNLQAKATKVRHPELDNIAPDWVTQGPPGNYFFPVRIYDPVSEREMTQEEIYKDMEWLNYSDPSTIQKKDNILRSLGGKAYPNTDADKASFGYQQIADFEEKEKEDNGLDSDNQKQGSTPRRRTRKARGSGGTGEA